MIDSMLNKMAQLIKKTRTGSLGGVESKSIVLEIPCRIVSNSENKNLANMADRFQGSYTIWIKYVQLPSFDLVSIDGKEYQVLGYSSAGGEDEAIRIAARSI